MVRLRILECAGGIYNWRLSATEEGDWSRTAAFTFSANPEVVSGIQVWQHKSIRRNKQSQRSSNGVDDGWAKV
jgi:hypothetical protein